MSDVRVELGPVQETLLIPLLGRAEQTRRRGGLLHDPKAVEIVERLDYDFTKWKGIRSLMGASIRAHMFDEEVTTFLDANPDGTVVEIGAGLNTRFERLDNGRAQWLEIDLPDSMGLRRQFFEDVPRRRMLAASVLDTDWLEEVAELPGPYCFVAEAVLIYLDNADAERALRQIGERFPGSWLVTDTTSTFQVENQHKHDAMKKMGQQSWFRWKCDDPASLSAWGLDLERSRSFLDAPREVFARIPLLYRVVFGWLPFLVRKQVGGYRITRFRFQSQPA